MSLVTQNADGEVEYLPLPQKAGAMSNEPEAVKPCPFCGSAADLHVHIHESGIQVYWVECDKCDYCLGVPEPNADEVVARWNRRFVPDAPHADWSRAPEGMTVWAVAADGTSRWYQEQPDLGDIGWFNGGYSWEDVWIDIPIGVDWRLLIERRPEIAS